MTTADRRAYDQGWNDALDLLPKRLNPNRVYTMENIMKKTDEIRKPIRRDWLSRGEVQKIFGVERGMIQSTVRRGLIKPTRLKGCYQLRYPLRQCRACFGSPDATYTP